MNRTAQTPTELAEVQAAPARVPPSIPPCRDDARLLRGRDRDAHDPAVGSAAPRLRLAGVPQHGADPRRDRQADAVGADLHRQGLGASILKAGLRLWDGGDLAGGRDEDHPTQHAASDGARSTKPVTRSRTSPAGTTSLRPRCRTRARGRLARSRGSVGQPGRRKSPPTRSRSCTPASRAWPHCTTCSPGETASVFRHTPGDPHPICYLRVLAGRRDVPLFLRQRSVGRSGAIAWTRFTRTRRARGRHAAAGRRVAAGAEDGRARHARHADARVPRGAAACARAPRARQPGGAHARLAERIGPALFTSSHWLWTESLRILALTGMQLATRPQDVAAILKLQEQSMLRLGGALQAA